jgi:hypothetical protein
MRKNDMPPGSRASNEPRGRQIAKGKIRGGGETCLFLLY